MGNHKEKNNQTYMMKINKEKQDRIFVLPKIDVAKPKSEWQGVKEIKPIEHELVIAPKAEPNHAEFEKLINDFEQEMMMKKKNTPIEEYKIGEGLSVRERLRGVPIKHQFKLT